MVATLSAPPGPKGHWLYGNFRDFSRDHLGFLSECARRYGDIVGLRLGPKRFLLLNHPDLVDEVLVDKHRHFIKHYALRLAKRSLGEGLITGDGEHWRRQRRLAQPAFSRDRLAMYSRVMVPFTQQMLETWAEGQTRDLHDDMMGVTLQIVAKTLFDADVTGDAADATEAMETVLRCFSARVDRMFRMPDFVPTPVNLRMKRAGRRLDRIIYRIIAEHRASNEDHGDLLTTLIRAHDEEDGGTMSDRQLRDEAMTMFMAGHETTANTLAWIWYLLSQNPEPEARLHAELDAVLGGRPPTFEDLPRLKYCEHVVTEALRVLPTVWIIGRECIEPCTVGGYPVRVGTTVFMSQWVLHRDPRFFDDPETFRPERWEGGLIRRLPRHAYFPFGGGPRICIGNVFAMMEAQLLLATIAQRFRLELAPGAVIRPWPSMTLRPDGGMPMIVHRRH